MIDELEDSFRALDSDVIEFIAPHGHALLRVFIVPSCRQAEELRAATSGPAVIACRCRLVRALLGESGNEETARLARLASLVFNSASEAVQ